MLGTLIYILLQVVLFGLSAFVLMERRNSERRETTQVVPVWRMISSLILAPIVGVAYASMGGWPLKTDQIIFTLIVTAVVYCSVIIHWIRQARIPLEMHNKANTAHYFYRSNDGTICGPFQQATLLSRRKSGFIDAETLIADEKSSQDWKPFRTYSQFQTQEDEQD